MYHQLHDPAFLAVASGGTPALDLFFSATKALDSRITFTRGSSGTFINSSGLVETAASGVARFTHNPSTLASLGLLIEESRTNLLLRSEEFDNAAWIRTNSTVTVNAAVAPDGTTTADKLIATVSGGTHQLRQTVSGGNARFSFSVFVKRADAVQNVYLELGNARVTVDASTGATLHGPDTFSTGWSAASVQVIAFGNGWFRVVLSATADTTVTSVECEIYNSTPAAGAAGNISFTGDGVSGVFIWGAQLEAGAFATSYIPTTSATVTRAADVATITGTNFSQWYRQDQGSTCIQFLAIGAGDAFASVVAGSTGSADVWGFFRNNSNSSIGYGHAVANIQSGNWLASNNAAASYTPVSTRFSLNGSSASSATGAITVTPASRLIIGNNTAGNGRFSGTIARIRYYRRRLPDANLQTLTT